ncbi:MAG: MotA/TolQ/ExbB proton channel family protein [Pseudomonadota bacterium]
MKISHLFEILNAGGIFMYGILCASIFAVGLIIHRVYWLWMKFRIDTPKLCDEVLRAVREGNYSRALQLAGGKHPLQEMMRAALARANRSEKEIRRGIETAAVAELARYRRGTAALPQLSNLATLLGLLGTIHGLIISFAGMSDADAATRQAALSKGVAIAFYNTFFGLTVATVTVVAYLIVSSKQGKELTRMEHSMASLVDELLTSSEARRARAQGGGGAAAAAGVMRGEA